MTLVFFAIFEISPFALLNILRRSLVVACNAQPMLVNLFLSRYLVSCALKYSRVRLHGTGARTKVRLSTGFELKPPGSEVMNKE